MINVLKVLVTNAIFQVLSCYNYFSRWHVGPVLWYELSQHFRDYLLDVQSCHGASQKRAPQTNKIGPGLFHWRQPQAMRITGKVQKIANQLFKKEKLSPADLSQWITFSLCTILALHPEAQGSILGIPGNFSLDFADIYWHHCLEQWTEAW